MSNFRPSISLLVFLTISGTMHMARPAHAKDDEPVFEKALSSKQKSVVLRHELEGAAKEHAQQRVRDEAKPPLPDFVTRMPDHFYTYTFKLSSINEKSQGELWQMPRVDYDDDPSKFTVFDACYEASSATLIFVYKTHGGTFGEVIDIKTVKKASSRKVPPMFLQDQTNQIGIVIESLLLGGSLSKHNLTVSATNNIAEQYTFSWDAKADEWKLSDFKPSTNPDYKNFTKSNLPDWGYNSHGF